MHVMQHCMHVVNPIMFDKFAFFFNCITATGAGLNEGSFLNLFQSAGALLAVCASEV